MNIQKFSENTIDDKPNHVIYYYEVRYTNKNIIRKLTDILNILKFVELNSIPYDIKFDVDFKTYFIYFYPKNISDEKILIKNYFNWYSWQSTVDRFRTTLVNSFDDVIVHKEDIEMILSTNKFNI